MKERYWKYSLIVFILGLGYLLFRQAQPFMNGILGGFTLYLLLRNFTFWLQTKMKPALAVWLVTIGVTLFILIPLSLFSWALVSQVSKMHFDTEAIIRPAWHVIDFVKDVRVSIFCRRKVCHFCITGFFHRAVGNEWGERLAG